MKPIQIIFSVVVFMIVSLITVQSGIAADGDPLQTQAIQLIIETADSICFTVKNEGTASLTEYSGEASIELSKALKSLADLGIEGAAKYQRSEYQGPLREDLVESIIASQDCKLAVFKRLESKLILSRNADASDESEERKRARDAVKDPYNYAWTCNIAIENYNGQSLAAGELVFGKVIDEPKMSYARVHFNSRRTQRLGRDISFNSGAWSLGFFGKCLEAECMAFGGSTNPYEPVFLINKVIFDEKIGKIDLTGVVMIKEYGKHKAFGRLSGECIPR